MEETKNLDLNTATYIGIDAHPSTHTALAMNRFEEEKSHLQFENTTEGIKAFLVWLQTVAPDAGNTILGIEGGSTSRHALLSHLLAKYHHVYEVNPVYTRQRRNAGTRGDKSDIVDAKLIAEVLTKKRSLLPKITGNELSSRMLCLKKVIGFYEEQTEQGARLKNQLSQLKREQGLSLDKSEKAVLSYVIKTKENEITAIRKIQRELATQMRVLLADHGDNLATMPGVGIVAAAKIVAHSSGVGRFANRDKFVRYAGIAPLERSSGKYQRVARGKKGNRNLHTTFYMAALNQIQWNSKAKEYYEKKLAEGKTKQQALVCVMKKTACVIYGMRSGLLKQISPASLRPRSANATMPVYATASRCGTPTSERREKPRSNRSGRARNSRK